MNVKHIGALSGIAQVRPQVGFCVGFSLVGTRC